jgi:hypothetical protein
MTDRFDRIEDAFEDFRSKVVELCDDPNPKKADIQDAYDRPCGTVISTKRTKPVLSTRPKRKRFKRCFAMTLLSRAWARFV